MDDFLNNWFAQIKISNAKKNMLLDRYIRIETIWNTSINELEGLSKEEIEKIKISKNIDILIIESDLMRKNLIRTINIKDDIYPQKLRQISGAPVVLYYKGNINLINEDTIGIIGTRYPTYYGKKTSNDIAKYLSDHSIVVVSGMALGIDMYAHIGAIKGSSKKTIAVLGNGLLEENIYPQSNLELFKAICENGGLAISEYPIHTKASKEFFPVRNRIIAALSDKIIVVEAGMRSGTFITVDFALDYGKEVFAVPGGIYSEKSIGCNQLIKEGANPFCNIKDIL